MRRRRARDDAPPHLPQRERIVSAARAPRSREDARSTHTKVSSIPSCNGSSPARVAFFRPSRFPRAFEESSAPILPNGADNTQEKAVVAEAVQIQREQEPVEKKIQQLREIFADAPQLGKTALENA